MANKGAIDQDQALEKELNQLKREYEGLKEDKVRTEQDLSNLEKQLSELEARAMAEYGACDPAELEKILQQRREENKNLVSRYQAHIKEIKSALESVENQGEVG